MRRLPAAAFMAALLMVLGLAAASAASGGGPNGSPQCPVQSPQGSIAQQAGNTVGPPCGYAVGLLGVCPPHSPNSGNSGPPCGHPATTTTTAAPAACGPSNPPTGPVSSIVFSVGEAIGNNPIGMLVEQVACAVFTNLGL